MSTILELPFNSFPSQNVDQVSLTNVGRDLFDGYIEQTAERNITIKRPGLEVAQDLQTGIKVDSSFWWDAKQLLILVSDGKVFKMESKSLVAINITGDELTGSSKATFASNGKALTIANGENMVYTDGNSLTASVTDPDAPQSVSHVVFIDFFILAFEKGTETIFFADFSPGLTDFLADPGNPNGFPKTWQSFNVFSAETSPDGLLALDVSRRTLLAAGQNSIEFFIDDGVTPFTRLAGSELDHGIMSPFAIKNIDGVYYLFDDNRRLRRVAGSSTVIVNTNFDKLIQSFDVVNDATMDFVTVLGKRWLLIHFPTENRTIFYDIEVNYWAEWSFFNPGTAQRDIFLGAGSYAYAKGFNLHIFGSIKDSRVFAMSDSNFDDAADPVHYKKTTGFLTSGSPLQKKDLKVIGFTLKRGIGKGAGFADKASAFLRYRDSTVDDFSDFLEIDLGALGDNEIFFNIYDLGDFEHRQFEVTCSDPVPFIMTEVTAKMDIEEI